MIKLLCRNQVKSYTKWRKIFDADAAAHRNAGLVLSYIGREKNKGNTVFFIFDVTNWKKPKPLSTRLMLRNRRRVPVLWMAITIFWKASMFTQA